MTMIPSIDTIGKPIDPNYPVMTYADGNPDTGMHPFVIVATDNDYVYAFAMTSSDSQLNQTLVSEALFHPIDPKNANYTNTYYAKEGSINCQNIQRIDKKDLQVCKSIGFVPRPLKFTLMAKHIYAQDNQIAKKDDYTETVMELLKYPVSHFRFGEVYKNLHTKFSLTPEAKYALEVQQERVKKGIYSTEKTIYHNNETGKIEIKKQYSHEYHERKSQYDKRRDFIKDNPEIARELAIDAFMNASNNYYDANNNQEVSQGRGRGRGAA